MTYEQESNLVIAAMVVFVCAIMWAIGETHQAKRACYARGYEFVDGNYFGGTTYCVELVGATRKVITIQR